MHPTLNIALRAANAAAEKLVYTREHWATLEEEAGSTDAALQTLFSTAAHRVFKVLHNAYPKQRVHCTETGDFDIRGPEADTRWAFSLLLGKSNFLRGLSGYGVLVTQWQKERLEHACLVFPQQQLEVFVSRGRGVQVNGRRVRILPQDRLTGCYFAGDHELTYIFTNLSKACAQTRISGCPLLDMADLAAGKLDIIIAQQLNSLEMATAQILATEAGAVTGALNGAPLSSKDTALLSANPRVFKAAISSLRDSKAE